MGEYNGWTNYKTCCVNLWLSNDEGLYYSVLEMARGYAHEEDEAYDFANRLKDFVDEIAEMTCPGCREGASFVSDLLGAALSEVNWMEIAEGWLEDARETVN